MMHESLPSPWREWVRDRALAMGLPDADDYLLLLVRLEKQRHDLAAILHPRPADSATESARNVGTASCPEHA